MTAAALRSLSDFDVMWERLENWGRDGRSNPDRPDPEAGTAQIYHMGRADKGAGEQTDTEGESFWNDDDPPPTVDSRDAENLDGYIRQLGERHRNNVRGYFYKRRHIPRLSIDEAVRALCDMEQANLAVRDRMRGRV